MLRLKFLLPSAEFKPRNSFFHKPIVIDCMQYLELLCNVLQKHIILFTRSACVLRHKKCVRLCNAHFPAKKYSEGNGK